MGISPHDGEKLIADEIRRIYSNAELEIVKKIANRVDSDADNFGSQSWVNSKLGSLRAIKNEVNEEVIEYLKDANSEVLEAVEKAYKKGQVAAEVDLKDLDQTLSVTGRFNKVDQRMVEELAGETINKLNDTHLRILSETENVYRDVISRATEGTATGVDTRRQASQNALNQFADKGVTGFVDDAGRNWSLASYVETATRSASGRAAIRGNIQRMKDNDHDLVMVSDHGDECSLCRPWEGRVLSISGKSDKYPSVNDAISAGLFHPNCYSEDTEVYTDEGWKLFQELNGTEKIFSLNPDNHIPEWVSYKHIISYEVDDELIEFKSNSFNLLVTKNHNMYAGFNSHKNGEKITNWKLREAEQCMTQNFKQIRTVNWEGKSKKEFMGIDMKVFAKLLGYYLSEGHTEQVSKNSHRIIISQSNKENRDKMLNDLSSMNFKQNGNKIYTRHDELSKYLSKLGKSHEKYIPKWFLEQNNEILEIFLDAFRLGDGSTRIRKYKGFETVSKIYFTSSEKLAEQLGEVIIKCGYYPSFSLMETKDIPVKHHNGIYKGNHNMWVLRQNNSKCSYHNVSPSIAHRGIQSKKVPYKGMVYDVELEKYHILLVRRKGKIAWSGNCRHNLSAYVHGLTKTEKGTADPEGAEQRRKQRYNERGIRKWKRREAGAFTEQEKRKAKAKVREWQKKQREFIKETGRKRKYSREQIDQAR